MEVPEGKVNSEEEEAKEQSPFTKSGQNFFRVEDQNEDEHVFTIKEPDPLTADYIKKNLEEANRINKYKSDEDVKMSPDEEEVKVKDMINNFQSTSHRSSDRVMKDFVDEISVESLSDQ